jgi:hypothetical protein
LGGTEHAKGSFQKVLRARRHEGEFGGDAEALVSPQREALTGFAAGGAAGWHALLALSLAKVRFVGMESIKLDRAEAVMMFAVCKASQKIFCESFEKRNKNKIHFYGVARNKERRSMEDEYRLTTTFGNQSSKKCLLIIKITRNTKNKRGT